MGSRKLSAGIGLLLAGCGLNLDGSLVEDGGSPGTTGDADAATAPPAEAGANGGGGGVDASDAASPPDATASVDAADAGTTATLSLTVTPDPPDVDLTQQGGVDWAHWGDHADGSPVRKATGGGVIGNYVVTGAVCNDNMGPSWPINAGWSDGLPPDGTSVPTNLHRRFYGTTGLTISLSIPCDGSSHVLSVDLGGWSSQSRFEASFDNIASTVLQDTRGNLTDYYSARYAVTYVCPPSTHVVVKWIATNLPPAAVCAGSDMILSSAFLR